MILILLLILILWIALLSFLYIDLCEKVLRLEKRTQAGLLHERNRLLDAAKELGCQPPSRDVSSSAYIEWDEAWLLLKRFDEAHPDVRMWSV